MARPLRLEFPGAVYHVTSRGDRREPIFLDDEDRQQFLHLLGLEVRQQGWQLYAYCLMTNHFHLLIETPEPNLGRGMRRLNGVYTQAFNRRHDLVGHLFQGRYKAIVEDRDAYLSELCRYVVLNPVRAGMVAQPDMWPWSSYAATAGAAAAPDWLAVDAVRSLFHPSGASAKGAYARFVAQGMGLAAPWTNLAGQMYLGDDAFLARMENLAAEQPAEDVPAIQRRPLRPSHEVIVDAVAKVYGLESAALFSRVNQQAFQVMVYLLRRVANLSLKEVARLASISPPRVSQIQARIEANPPTGPLASIWEAIK